MERTKKNKLLLLGLLMVIILAIPLTVFILQKQQENRSKASAATTLFFTPEGTAATPLVKTIGDTVTVDLMVNPGINLVSLVRYSITYNPLFMSPATSNAFVLNATAFKKNVEGPIYDPIKGTISGSVSIGSDYTDAIQSLTKVATLSFKTTAISSGTTPIGFGSETEVYSLASTELSNENVLASGVPTLVTINPLPTPTVDPNSVKLQVTSSLKLDKATLFLGETISGTVVYKNNNAFPVTITKALINGRDPNAGIKDFNPSLLNKTLAPGESATLSASQTVALTDPVGTYNAFESYQLLGQSTPTIGTLVAFYTVNRQPTPTPTNPVCLQVITYAKNPATNECKSYASPCNVPVGWTTVDECPVATPTPTPTLVPTATPTPVGKTTFVFNILLHGIGSSGDNVNTSALGSNKNPLTKLRNLQVSIVDGTGFERFKTSVGVTFDPTSGSFTGQSSFGPAENFMLAAGFYQLKFKTERYLRKQIPILQITPGTTIILPTLTLVNGDSNNDNIINVLDYNMIMDCYSDVLAARACTDANKKLMTDLTDDGKVNQYDYNLFLRELSVQVGE